MIWVGEKKLKIFGINDSALGLQHSGGVIGWCAGMCVL